MTDQLTNAEVDDAVRKLGNWDVNKTHTRKLRDEINDHFGAFWLDHLTPCQDGITDVWGVSIVQTVPELSRHLTSLGRFITKHYTGSGHARDFVQMKEYFCFDQRFLINREATARDPGFTIALRCQYGSWSPSVMPYRPNHWAVDIDALKLLYVNRAEEMAAQNRVREFLAMLRLAS